MEWKATWNDPLTRYLAPYHELIGDKRTHRTFWEEVQLIAKLGGWEPHKDRKPGKITLMRGLRRLIDLLATQAILSQYVAQHEALPPNLIAFLQGWTPPNEL